MNRLIFGLVAGASTLAAYHWHTTRKRNEVPSVVVNDVNEKSSVDSQVSSADITDEPSPSRTVLNDNLVAELALFKEEVLGLKMERDSIAVKNGALAAEVVDVQCKLQAALTNAQDLQTAFDSRDSELLEIRSQLVASVARIAELESVNCCQINKIAELELSAQHQAKLTSITPESMKNEKPDLRDASGDKVEPSPPSVHDDVHDVTAPPVAPAVPRSEKIPQKPEAPVFATSDIRYRNKPIEGYTVIPVSGGNQPTITPTQDPVAELKPVAPPVAKQENLPTAGSCDFTVMDAIVENELPRCYQLLNIDGKHYGHIIGKDGKNIKKFEDMYIVKVTVSPPRGPRARISVSVTQGMTDGRRAVAKMIVQSLPAIVEVPVASLTSLSPQRIRQLWHVYYVKITEDALAKKWVLSGKLGSCLRLLNEQKTQKV